METESEKQGALNRKTLRKLIFIYKTLLLGYSVSMIKGTNQIAFTKSNVPPKNHTTPASFSLTESFQDVKN